MILVDTSIWIDHLHSEEPRLVSLLGDDEVGSHPMVVAELALGSMRRRDEVLSLLGHLWQFPVLTHGELLALVERRRLWGCDLSAIDVHLLGSAALAPDGRLWTRDKRLLAACRDAGVAFLDES